jgi:nitrite reductase (cytochrome c-552)
VKVALKGVLMATPKRSVRSYRNVALLAGAFILGGLIMAGIAALLVNVQTRMDEAKDYPAQVVQIADNELDPAVWGKNFPREYDRFMMTRDDTISTPYGGSVPFNKLERYPALVRIWAGYPFSVEYNKARGHYYALADQLKTKRIQVSQPATCANCHAAEAPQLIQQMAGRTATRPQRHQGQTHTANVLCRLPHTEHDGSADHPPGVHQCHEGARH